MHHATQPPLGIFAHAHFRNNQRGEFPQTLRRKRSDIRANITADASRQDCQVKKRLTDYIPIFAIREYRPPKIEIVLAIRSLIFHKSFHFYRLSSVPGFRDSNF